MSTHTSRPITYGGEVELLVVQQSTGSLIPFDHHVRNLAQQATQHLTDSHNESPNIDYDASTHQLEIGAGVYSSLTSLVRNLQETISCTADILEHERQGGFISSSYHPVDRRSAAYHNVLPKPIYELWRGPYQTAHLHPHVLPLVYPDNPDIGRGWNHEIGSISASIQPWNSVTPESASQQLALIQGLGWLFNLLTANSPFTEQTITGKRDSRLEIWEAMLGVSRYAQDYQLSINLPQRPNRLVDYYQYVFGQQRPMVIAANENAQAYKQQFLALVQPPTNEPFTILSYLQAPSANVVNIETGETFSVKPNVSHVVNGYDFFYYPRYGARLRLKLPYADTLDPSDFAQAIINGDEEHFQALLQQGGIDQGFICIEGRSSATVLPTQTHPHWKRFSIPFVLQTALVRSYREVWQLLDDLEIPWQQLAHELPLLTNSTSSGFQTRYKQFDLAELAQLIWSIASTSLTEDEYQLVDDEIDQILSRRAAPADEQLAHYHELYASGLSNEQVFTHLLSHLQAHTKVAADIYTPTL